MNIKIILTIVILIISSVSSHAQPHASSKENLIASIYDLPPFERAICCIKYYEGLHRAKDFPYVGYGHRLQEGEHYSSNMSATQAEDLLRKDLTKLCRFFRSYGKDSLLLASLAYNVGSYRIIGTKTRKRSSLIKKIEAGIRNFQQDYLGFCKWNGRFVPSIQRRRYAELLLLYNP